MAFIVVWKLLSRLRARPRRPDVDKKGRAWASISCSEPLHGCSFLLVVLLAAPPLPGDIFSVFLSQKNEMKNEVSLSCFFLTSELNIAISKTLGVEGGKNRRGVFILFCSLLSVYFLLVLQVHVLKRLDWMLR